MLAALSRRDTASKTMRVDSAMSQLNVADQRRESDERSLNPRC
jgi:hypothetical protein